MKTKLTILLILLCAVVAWAADLVITIPPADIPRVSEAYGSILGLGRNATIQEVQAAEKQNVINQTRDYERRKNMAQYTPPPLEMQPSPSPTPTPGTLKAEAVKAAPTPTPKKK